MSASRELFWNIPLGSLVYLFGLAATIFIAYVLYGRVRLWRAGRADNRLQPLSKRVWSFIGLAVTDGLAHRRLIRQPYSGIMHLMLFLGFILLFIGTTLDAVNAHLVHFLHGSVYLWFSLVLDIAGVMVLAGLLMAFLRRYVERPRRLDRVMDDAVVLSLLAGIVLTGFVIEGARIAVTELVAHPDWAAWSPVGHGLARLMNGMSEGGIQALHRTFWWSHLGLSVGTVVYAGFAFSKFTHMLVAPVNAFFRSLGPRGVPERIDIMNEIAFGAGKIQDLRWKHRLDLDACTRCGRCQDVCPAYLSGKSLSPKKLVQNLKAHMVETGLQAPPAPAGPGAAATAQETEASPEKSVPSLIGDIVTEDEIWSCTTCAACEEACPIFVEHPDKIISMRRNLVLEQARIPPMAQISLVNTQQLGYPWKGAALSRIDWMTGLHVPVAAEGGDPGVLFWPGCTGALVERNAKATAAFARLLLAAGVKFSVLAEQESCCGHPARRLGDEYLFQVQAEANIETLKSRNVRTIVTSCPHCYHTLKNEYPQFGARFAVMHHSELLVSLIRQGKLETNGASLGMVTYHDPCYLGRYNSIYEAPRRVLESLPGVKLAEMRHNKSGGICCGGGGGRIWFEENPDKRVNQLRAKEVIATGAGVVTTGCPFCLQMIEDAIKALGKEESLRTMDLAEVVEASVKVVARKTSEEKSLGQPTPAAVGSTSKAPE